MSGVAVPLLPGVELGDVRRRHRRRRTSRRRSTRARRTAWPRSTPTGRPRNYREAYGLFAVNGILFNHESPASRRDVRDPQDHPRGRPDQGRPRRPRLHGQPRRRARLGLRAGVRRGHVADAPGRRARRLRAGHRHARSRSATSWRRRSATPASTGRSTCASTSATCGPPRSTRCAATPARPSACSAGSRRSTRTQLAQIMVDADIEALDARGHGRGSTRSDPARLAGDAMTDASTPGPLDRDATTYVAGHRGMVGSAVWRRLEAAGFTDLRGRASSELDLRDRDAVVRLLRRDPASLRRAGRRQGRRHPGQRHLPGGVPLRQPADPDQRDGRRPRAARRAAAVPRARPASTRGSRRSRSARTPCSPATSSRPTTPTRSPRSPASSASRPSAASTACRGSRRCRPTSTARATTSRRPAATCCPR